ncbi:MAG: energy-coupling factor transporter ATPase [Bacillota bacterium]
MNSPIIETIQLSYDYSLDGEKEIRALDNLSLKICEGEYLCLIGPNGSGKSTLARHLNALLLPAAGDVYVDGLLTALEENRWEIRRRVGLVFQNPDNQIVATTVEEDVAFGLENLGIAPPIILQRVAEALELVGLKSLAQHAPHLLSGGQKQRLAIAGVLAMRPRCLVLDEPTAMLDPRGRREVLATIRMLNRQERVTVVHITHFMEETLEADRIIVLDRGRIACSGSPAEIFSGKLDLEALGMDMPPIPALAMALREGGLAVPQGILHVDQLVEFLC